jgi:hypothetical protein
MPAENHNHSLNQCAEGEGENHGGHYRNDTLVEDLVHDRAQHGGKDAPDQPKNAAECTFTGHGQLRIPGSHQLGRIR